MRTAILAILSLALIACIQANELKAYSVPSAQITTLTPKELVDLISDAQPEVMKKAVKHYLIQEVQALQKSYSPNAVKETVCNWFKAEELGKKSQEIANYMHSRLFVRLDMGKLSESFKKEIENNPEAYFLSYEMYDLLIDE